MRRWLWWKRFVIFNSYLGEYFNVRESPITTQDSKWCVFFASSSSFFCIFSSCFLSLFKCLTFDYEVLDLEFQPQILTIFPSQELVSRTQLKTEFFSNFASAESVSREINKHHEAFPHADWSFTKAFHWDDPGWVWMAQHCSLSTIIDDFFFNSWVYYIILIILFRLIDFP